jgi:hypothetical protein
MAIMGNQNGRHTVQHVLLVDKLFHSCHGNKKGGIKTFFGFLSSSFIKLCRNIHCSVWQLLGGWKNSKNSTQMVQNGHHGKPKWSPYGAACLTPCKYPFPLKFFHF